MAQNPLPSSVPTYSVVTLPQPERISSILRGSTRKLSTIDGRNDSQVIFYDQVIPGSTLLGYVNADHWAIAVPIARTHTTVGVDVRDRRMPTRARPWSKRYSVSSKRTSRRAGSSRRTR